MSSRQVSLQDFQPEPDPPAEGVSLPFDDYGPTMHEPVPDPERPVVGPERVDIRHLPGTGLGPGDYRRPWVESFHYRDLAETVHNDDWDHRPRANVNVSTLADDLAEQQRGEP